MTRFERDLRAALDGDERAVIAERRAEIEKLIAEGKKCRNAFRLDCIAQEVARLQDELRQIEETI